MKVTDVVDRFMYGAISILFTILIAIGSWSVLRIIDHETRLSIVEGSYLKVTDVHGLDKRVDRLEYRRGIIPAAQAAEEV